MLFKQLFQTSEFFFIIGIRISQHNIISFFMGNFIISSFLVVISMMVTKHVFYIVLVLLGFVSALLIEVPLKEIEKLNMHKFLFLRVILPLLALVNIAVFMSLKVLFENMTGMGLYFNPIIAGVAYGIVFVLPHIAASFNR